MYLRQESRVDQIEEERCESSDCCRWGIFSCLLLQEILFLVWQSNKVTCSVILLALRKWVGELCSLWNLLCVFCFSDNSILSEEKQRILMLERVIYFHMYIFYWQALIIAFVKYIIICNYLLLFQTLHMKEEENKRLSQRLVNIYFFICVCVCCFDSYISSKCVNCMRISFNIF